MVFELFLPEAVLSPLAPWQLPMKRLVLGYLGVLRPPPDQIKL